MPKSGWGVAEGNPVFREMSDRLVAFLKTKTSVTSVRLHGCGLISYFGITGKNRAEVFDVVANLIMSNVEFSVERNYLGRPDGRKQFMADQLAKEFMSMNTDIVAEVILEGERLNDKEMDW